MRGLLAPHTPPGHTNSLRSESPTWLSNEHSVCIYLEFNPKDSILDIKPFIVKTSIHTQNRIIYSEHPYAHKSIGIWPLSVLDVFLTAPSIATGVAGWMTLSVWFQRKQSMITVWNQAFLSVVQTWVGKGKGIRATVPRTWKPTAQPLGRVSCLLLFSRFRLYGSPGKWVWLTLEAASVSCGTQDIMLWVLDCTKTPDVLCVCFILLVCAGVLVCAYADVVCVSRPEINLGWSA